VDEIPEPCPDPAGKGKHGQHDGDHHQEEPKADARHDQPHAADVAQAAAHQRIARAQRIPDAPVCQQHFPGPELLEHGQGDRHGDEHEDDEQKEHHGQHDACDATRVRVGQQEQQGRCGQQQQHDRTDPDDDPDDQLEQPEAEGAIGPAQPQAFAPGGRVPGLFDLVDAANQRGARHVLDDDGSDHDEEQQAAATGHDARNPLRLKDIPEPGPIPVHRAIEVARVEPVAGASAAATAPTGERDKDAEDPQHLVAPDDVPRTLHNGDLIHDTLPKVIPLTK